MSRVFAFLLLSIFAVTSISQQNSRNLDSAVHHIQANDPASALSELEALRRDDPISFDKDDGEYLYGRLSNDNGRKALAFRSLHSVASGDSQLRPYALKHLSRIARSTGNLTLEKLLLSELSLTEPQSLPAQGARLRAVGNRIEVGDAREALRLLNGNGLSGSDVERREAQVLYGQAMLIAGEEQKAYEVFASLISESPDRPDHHSLTAVRAVDRVDSARGSGTHLSEDELSLRSNIYYFHREFAEARKHLETIIAASPDGPRAAESIFRIGTSHTSEGNFAEGLKWFERVIERFPDTSWKADSLLHSASAYSRLGKPREAVKRYEMFIADHAEDPRLVRAYLNTVDVLRDQGEDTEALRWCLRTREAFKGRTPEAVALFAEARIHIARETWADALTALYTLMQLKELGGTSVPGGTSRTEITFLHAFCLEQMGRYPEAIDTYLSVKDGRGEYYGWRATERLRSLAKHPGAKSYADEKIGKLFVTIANETGEAKEAAAMSVIRLLESGDLRERAIDALRASVKRSSFPSFASGASDRPLEGRNSVAGRLIRLGLYDEASVELSIGDGRADGYFDVLARGRSADKVMQTVEPAWRKVAADLPLEVLPKADLQLLYPAPFASDLLRYSSQRNVDPRFMLAIMRQESRFDANAASSAAARGLMQFIAPTASRTAGQLGVEPFSQEDLFAPSTAILFGSQYISELFTKFPEQPDAVAAAYNGGEDNMARWLTRSRSNLPDRYVPEILYQQSKDYVTKVLSSYRVYCYLYDERLRPQAD